MIHRLRHMVLLLALTGLFCSCTQVEDARRVVAEADSLRAVGMAYDDSLAIAKAAATLSHVRNIYPTDYARANYYYGRLLRTRGDQPAAMLAFLNVVHSRTEDHAVIARAYSNMGTMSHSAGEFSLSYDMYEKCAEHFILAGDTIAYNYARDEMAIELAEMNLRDETLALIDDITHECSYWPVIAKAYEAQAILYCNIEQYDSTLSSVERMQAYGNHEPTGYVKKAQAFWYLENYDSALVYAKLVMDMPDASPRDQYNMLYILTYNDTTIDSEQIRQLSEERSDVDRYIIDPWLTQLTQATELLKYDLAQKPDLRWLFAVILTLVIIGTILMVYIKRKHRKRQLISQQTEELLQKNEQLAQHAMQLQSAHSEYEEKVKHDVMLFCQNVLANPDPKQAICWGNYEQMCEIINTNMFGLATKLEDLNLAEHEIEFCVLVLLQLSRKECAEWMHLGESSMGGKKRDTAKKLGQKSANLYDFLLSLACK